MKTLKDYGLQVCDARGGWFIRCRASSLASAKRTAKAIALNRDRRHHNAWEWTPQDESNPAMQNIQTITAK